MKLTPHNKLLISVIFSSLLLVSCVTQLAPSYNNELIVGINDINKKSLIYFESMSADFSTVNYEDSKDTYNEIIGLTQSLIAQSEARPVPESKALKKLNKILEERGQPIWDPENNLPSTVALQGVMSDFKLLKAMHADGSINKTKFELRKSAIKISLDQAMTFEYALER